jgi:predicted transcriptional regulator
MPILKTPPKQLRSATIQVRVEEEITYKLRKYAEFIDCSPAYVVSEALKLLFNKDNDFREWLPQHAHDLRRTQMDKSPAGEPTKGVSHKGSVLALDRNH